MTESRAGVRSAEVKATVRRFVVDNLALGRGVTSVRDDESLVNNGVIDSLGIFQMVTFLEETFRIRIGDDEITQENMQSIDRIERFVVGKLPTGRG